MDRHVVTLLAMTTRRWRFALAIGVCHCEPGWAGAAIQLGIQMDRHVVTLLAMTSVDRHVASLLSMTNGRHDSARAAEVDCGFAAALADDFAVAFE